MRNKLVILLLVVAGLVLTSRAEAQWGRRFGVRRVVARRWVPRPAFRRSVYRPRVRVRVGVGFGSGFYPRPGFYPGYGAPFYPGGLWGPRSGVFIGGRGFGFGFGF